MADAEDGFSGGFQIRHCRRSISLSHNDCHAYPAVEGARHFFRLDMALRLQEGHQARLRPEIGIDMRVQAFGKDTRDVFKEAAPGDVRHRMHLACTDERQKLFHVNPRRGHQRVDEEHVLIEQGRAVELPSLVSGEATHQREAVGMHARRGETKDDVAVGNLVGGQHLGPLDSADAEAREIIVAIGIHARHFRRFTTDKRASGLLAAFGDARDDAFRDISVELSAGIVIEEEERLCPLHDQIIRAHGNKIDADAVMLARFDGKLELRADPVIGGHKQRIGKASSLQIEKPAEPAQIRVCAGPPRGLGQGRNRADQGVARRDGDASLGVGIGFGGVVLGVHFSAASDIALGIPRPTRQKARVTFQTRHLRVLPFAIALCVGAMGIAVYAQLEGGERGVPPIDSASNFEVSGVVVDVAAKTADAARMRGWREAQRLGWKKLWEETHGPGAPGLSDGALDSIVSGIVVEDEQIGPNRYIARLGVLFDRVRTSEILGVAGNVRRSAPLLVVPIQYSGGLPQSFETRTEWQKAWARFRTADSVIDYVRPTGGGADPLLLTASQTKRPGRRWWRMLLDQYGAADLIIPQVRLERLYPGGPVLGHFSAFYGPDSRPLGNFTLRVGSSAGIPKLMDEGVRRLDALFAAALASGKLAPDTSLVIEKPVDEEELEPTAITDESGATGEQAVTTADEDRAAAAATKTFSVQFDTPDVASVTAAESAVRAVPGVRSASTSSLALGGVSVMRVAFDGDVDMLRLGLSARGYRVTVAGDTIRIRR